MSAAFAERRRGYLDRSPGEDRGVVTLDGRPERLLIVREGDETPRLGLRYAARVEAVSARMGLARLDLGGVPGTLRVRAGETAPDVGRLIHVEVLAEPARGKPAALRRLDDAPPGSRPCRLNDPPSVAAQLAALGAAEVETGDRARETADEAQAEALATLHALDGGMSLAIEPTRALTAIDVDLAETGSAVSVGRANLLAIEQAARLLRLKAIGGLVAIDLIGFPKDGRRLQAAAVQAFAPDGPDVAIAPPSRFGVLELAKPNAAQPLHERLLDPAGGLCPRAAAHAVVRALERQGRFDPGAGLVALCPPEVAALAAPWAAMLGPRFGVRAQLGAARTPPDIRSL